MKIQKLYAITSNSDTTEGRGSAIIHGYCTTHKEALKVVSDPRFYKRHGVMGCAPYKNGEYDVREKEIKIFESADEFFSDDTETQKKTALNKLTPTERKLLGLTGN